jgi:pyruvate formate-lyase activating enzyme-like uncharacterized protein
MGKISKTKYYSYKIGELPKGCQYCVKGEKMVLFITGLCSRFCYYCPLSDQKKNKDFVWADEWKIQSKQDVITEAKLIDAKGAGISGGDPLLKIDRTVDYIELLKKNFGNKFHIHLYAPLEMVTEIRLEKLAKAGLDEIRFHPDLDNKKNWGFLKLATGYNWDMGIEIPVIPHKKKEMLELINYILKIKKISFLNLNELEISDTNCNQLLELGYRAKNELSYGVKGSEELALSLLKVLKKTKLNVHYCSAKLKDKVQLANRIKRRAKNVAKKYDIVTKEGMLIRGALYLKKLYPGFNYRLKLEQMNKKPFIKKLYKLKRNVKSTFNIPADLIEVDEEKIRILLPTSITKKYAKQIKKKKLIPTIVEEYPTHDQTEMDIEFL